MSKIIKIVAIGPESTGKSTLCTQLAAHYNTPWCPEYAREYLLTHGTKYTYNDLLTIAKGQLAQEDKFAAEAEETAIKTNTTVPLFIDTDMYIMKVWCEYVFHQCHSFINEQIEARTYTHYLLCNPDLPWQPDILREYPDEAARIALYDIYKSLLTRHGAPFTDITGTDSERLNKAIETVDALLATEHKAS